MKALHVIDDRVSNIIEIDTIGSFVPDVGVLLPYTDGVQIGYIAINGIFQQDPTEIEQQAREQRDILLTASDIAVLPDRWATLSTEKQAEWAAYRQALRDLPLQSGFPTAIVWPIKPE